MTIKLIEQLKGDIVKALGFDETKVRSLTIILNGQEEPMVEVVQYLDMNDLENLSIIFRNYNIRLEEDDQ